MTHKYADLTFTQVTEIEEMEQLPDTDDGYERCPCCGQGWVDVDDVPHPSRLRAVWGFVESLLMRALCKEPNSGPLSITIKR